MKREGAGANIGGGDEALFRFQMFVNKPASAGPDNLLFKNNNVSPQNTV